MKPTILKRIIPVTLLFIFLNGFVFAQTINDIQITERFHDEPLKEFLDVLSQKYGVRVYYKESWVAPYFITKTFQNTPLLQTLNMVFAEHDLTFSLFQDNGIVVFRKTMDTRSGFDTRSQLLVIGDPINIGRYKTATLKGRVTDGKNGESLVGAVVYINKLGRGATTNGNGEFQTEIPTGEHLLQVSFVGFESSNVNIRLIESGFAEFALFEESHNIGEVTVVGEEADLPRSQMSMVQMTSLEIKQLPALMGEVDVLKGLTMLAGVQTVSELSSGFNVRGGNTDQNLILVDGSPVFNSSHLFGFLSLINPDVVEDVRLFKGGMPTKYGERVSSVMEVDFKEGNNEFVRLKGGIGIINSRITIDGPLSKDKKLTFVAGGRSSYTDWILAKIPDVNISRSVTNFYDASGKITYKFNPHNKLSVMGYLSNDEFSTSSQSVTQYGSKLANLTLNTRIAEPLYGELQLAGSEYNYRLTDYAGQKPPEEYYLSNRLLYRSGAYHLKWHVTPRHQAEAGFKAVYNRISPGEITPTQKSTVIEHRKLNDEKTLEWAAYIGDEFEILPQFSIAGGIRFTKFSNFGTPVVFIYDPLQPLSAETVIDSLNFGQNEVSKSYSGFEPRISVNYDLGVGTSLKMNYQRTRQNIFQLSNNAVISPAETWKAADYYLKPIISDQLALALENSSWLKTINFSAEFYYKFLQNLIEYKNGAQLIMNQNIETDLIPTRGFSYGIELSARKRTGRLTGYASYVYSRTMQKNTGEFEEENLWRGNSYRSVYDRPHDLSVTSTYNISRRWRASGNLVFISGRPVTLPELQYNFANERLVYFSDRNKYRMPPYHRMDVSLTFDQNLKKKRSWKGSWTLSVYNVYGRNNPYSVYYKKSVPGEENNYRSYSLYKLSVIGIPVPSLTYNFVY